MNKEETLAKILRHNAEVHSDTAAQMHKDGNGVYQSTSFRELYNQVRQFAVGLQSLGVKCNDHIGLISENRQEWLVSDLAVISLGAADVPRGCDSNADEIAYILSFSQCALAILENGAQLDKVLGKQQELPGLADIIILDPGFNPADYQTGRFTLHRYEDVLKAGANADLSLIDKEIDKGSGDDVATIIFTSGTTGEPKGAMLTHTCFIYQVHASMRRIGPKAGDRWISILPVWHAFERIMQYCSVITVATVCYSKPVGSILLEDMLQIQPQWMASVPRIWESVRDGIYRKVRQGSAVKRALFSFFVMVGSAWKHSSNMLRGLMPRFKKRSRIADFLIGLVPFVLLWPLRQLGNALVFKAVKQKLGGKFIAGISGGGGLPSHVDVFFQAADILLLEGYGLTESGPVLTLRSQKRPVPGTIGRPLDGTELKIVGEDGQIMGPNMEGVIHARGPQIMKGYYHRPELTAEAIDADGWLNTGDIGLKTHDNDYAVIGRAKDTIVLLGGENVEPAPIEEKLKLSPYIASGVLVGQDQHYLGALIQIDRDNITAWASENGVFLVDESSIFSCPEIESLISEEIAGIVSSKNGFKVYEKIVRFRILSEPFEIGRELSAKQEIKRHVIADMYSKEIKQLFER